MGTYYTLYCEARINGVWHNIDFYQRPLVGIPMLVPVIEGQSAVGSALRWYANPMPIKSEDLSAMTRSQESDRAESWQWLQIPGSWFADKDLNSPEFCGYFPKQDVLDYKSGLIDMINTEDILEAEAYLAFPDDGKLSYVYFEYTEPWGYKDVMNRIKTSVELRMRGCSSWLYKLSNEVRGDTFDLDWNDIRVIVFQE